MSTTPNAPRYRVWWIPQVPMSAFYYGVPSLEIARVLVDTLMKYDLFQLQHNVKPDYVNVGGIEVWDNELGDWTSYDDDDDDETSED